MIKILLAFSIWVIVLWFSLDSYSYSKKLSQAIIKMFHLLRVGICENRMSIDEIVKSESVFFDNGASDFSLFLWENHEALGIKAELIDSYNAFCRDSRTASGQVCDEGIVAIEKEFKAALSANQTELRSKCISFITVCTAVFAVTVILMV